MNALLNSIRVMSNQLAVVVIIRFVIFVVAEPGGPEPFMQRLVNDSYVFREIPSNFISMMAVGCNSGL